MDLRTKPGFQYYFWVGLALIPIFSMLKPAATSDASLIGRLIIWTIQVGVLLPMLIFTQMALQAVASINHLNPWLKLTLSGLIGSLLFVPLGLLIDFIFGLDDWSGIHDLNGWMSMAVKESGGVILPVTLTWIAINAPRILQLNFKETRDGTIESNRSSLTEMASSSKPNFFSLLPSKIGNDVVYLKSELHYVRVVTGLGEALVLFNLKDAIRELEKVERGIQTHRSYWVSAAHIASIATGKGGKFIITCNNQKIPVSRRRLAETKDYLRQNCL
jgi:hypothetical protein